jgi:hypothetical protein
VRGGWALHIVVGIYSLKVHVSCHNRLSGQIQFYCRLHLVIKTSTARKTDLCTVGLWEEC